MENSDSANRIINNGLDITFDPPLVEPSYANLGAIQNAQKSDSKFIAQPVDLVWDDITLTVPAKVKKTKSNGENQPPPANQKVILDGISGSVRSGQMLAVMGSSGAGKTSLLNLLAGRATPTKGAKATGSLTVNGEPRDYNTFRHISAYVLQDDDMFAELTVEEQVGYAATLRLPSTMSARSKNARVDRVIQELGLNKVRDTAIGGEQVRGVSGGERKRVAIATELVTDPSLLFLDEPTSGLDSFNALNVMQSLRLLASRGRTVVCTIHQPRSSIFALFDQLLLLSEGRTMYHGPAREAENYFSSIGFQAPPSFNPADFFVDLLSIDPRTPEKESTTRQRIEYVGEKHAEFYRPPDGDKLPKSEDVESANLLDDEYMNTEAPSKKKNFQNSWIKELVVLSGRSVKLATRSKVANGIQFFQGIFFSVLLGLLWLNNGRKTDIESKKSIPGILFFIAINISFSGAFSVIFQFPLERSVVTRERAANMYRTSSYFLSKTVTDLIRGVFFVSIFSVIVYFMVGLRMRPEAFFQFLLGIFLMSTFAESLALCVSILTGDPQASSSLVPVAVVLSLLFGGFFIENDTIPVWIRWFKWVSFIHYGFSALGHNQFPDGGNSQFAFNTLSYWANIGALLGLTAVVKFTGYLCLHYLRGPKFAKLL